MFRREFTVDCYLEYIDKDEGVALEPDLTIILSMHKVTENSFTPIFIKMTELLNNFKAV